MRGTTPSCTFEVGHTSRVTASSTRRCRRSGSSAATHPVLDSPCAERVQSGAHAVRTAVLTGMWRTDQAGVACDGERIREQLRCTTRLVVREAEANHAVTRVTRGQPGQLQSFDRRTRPIRVHDHANTDTQIPRCLAPRVQDDLQDALVIAQAKPRREVAESVFSHAP
jgi:hypothetical protein